MRLFAKWAFAGTLLATPALAHADVVVQNLGGNGGGVPTGYVGESFVTPIGYFYDGIAFNFYSNYR